MLWSLNKILLTNSERKWMEISLENLHVDIRVLRVKNTHYSSIDLLVSTVHVSGFSLRFQVARQRKKVVYVHQRTGRGGGCSPPCRKKNSIIGAKLMYRSGKDTVRWNTCCSERLLTTDGKRPLSYHSLLHMIVLTKLLVNFNFKVWGQWPGGFVCIGRNRFQPFSKHQQHPNCIKFLWRG